MDNMNQIDTKDITIEWMKLNKPEIVSQIIEDTNKKSFWRPSNIWRILGIFIATGGLFVPTFIVWDLNSKTQVTTNGLFISAGLLLVLIPSFKEILPAVTNLANAIRGNGNSSPAIPNKPEGNE